MLRCGGAAGGAGCEALAVPADSSLGHPAWRVIIASTRERDYLIVMSSLSLRVCCTSFLVPAPPFWQPLAEHGRLIFGEYGDWAQALLAGDDQPLIWVLFLADVIPQLNVAATADDRAAVYETLLSPLILRLQQQPAPVIVAWSGYRGESPLASARGLSPWQHLQHEFEAQLYALAARYPALHVLALDQALQGIGMQAAFDPRNYYAARCRLSRQGLMTTASALASLWQRIQRPPCKVLALDCDNTLWGGVVGEVGLAGIALGSDGMGKLYADLQAVARAWAQQGVLLVLLSKNNAADVWQVFDQHPGMVLKRDHIVASAINWQDKPGNLKQLMNELGLGLDSVLFVDDNPLERAAMREALPQVQVLELPAAVTDWPAALASADALVRFTLTADDQHKTAQYRERAAFISARHEAGDEHGFLQRIAMQPRWLALDAGTLARAEQLCAKTNQFNLRLQRHSAARLQQLAAEPGCVAGLVTLSDRFGDHGITGLAIARVRGEVAVLDTFLLSCRVLGRHLEAWLLAAVIARLRAQGVRWLLAQYCPGERNQLAADFLAVHGLHPFATCQDLRAAADNLSVESCVVESFAVDSLAVDSQALDAALALLGEDGGLYAAPLDTLTIPYLDLFDHVDAHTD